MPHAQGTRGPGSPVEGRGQRLSRRPRAHAGENPFHGRPGSHRPPIPAPAA